jgi:succinate dehydrogenase/fumarate reductase cytochrome b subunit
MSLGLLLIVIGIVLAILVHYALGIVLILIGLALIIVPRLSDGTRRV